LTYLGPLPERVMLVALKAFLLLNGFDTTQNFQNVLMSDTKAVQVGFLPRFHAADTAQYPSLYEKNASKEMAEGYAYRWKVPAPKSLVVVCLVCTRGHTKILHYIRCGGWVE
jgi:hypothetical protein